jgi:hypothetical protein
MVQEAPGVYLPGQRADTKVRTGQARYNMEIVTEQVVKFLVRERVRRPTIAVP